ncbi:unnamed protein product [Somion occarium]|uniref:Arrestin-like N-terminal domain-containing protein n=1 Tax=Somion occarium TaxID=3059160 RepID=A0ABP1DYU8_9APHY
MDTLPAYSPSSSVPSYHAEPSYDERCLDFSARSHRRVAPDGTFLKAAKGITLVLTEQESGTSIPTYTRHASVKGDILLEDERIQSVSLKLDGRQFVSSSESGSSNTHLFTESITLWSKSEHPYCSLSPAILPFDIPFPNTYREGKETRPLPPTFTAESPSVPGVSIRCEYTLTVTVTKPRLGGFKKHKRMIVPINYHPRSRPYLPIGCGLHPFLSTVKCAPGDWHQVSSTIKPRSGATIGSIEAHLFIPAVQIYAISDTIPFHLQLQGSQASLNAFLFSPESSPQARNAALRRAKTLSVSYESPAESHLSSFAVSLPFITRASSNPLLPEPPPSPLKPDPSLPWYVDTSRGKPTVRVYLLRQILVKVNGTKSWRNIVLGEGKMYPVQAQYHACPGAESYAEQALDWEGELKCNGDVTVGGFNSGPLVLKDFIMIELKPASPETSPLLEHQHPHPVRLVTDTYAES